MSHPKIFHLNKELMDTVRKHDFLSAEISCGTHNTVPTIWVSSYRALVRVVGSYKYRLDGRILFRGQTSCHAKMVPSAYRNGVDQSAIDQHIPEMLQAFRENTGTDSELHQALTTEPLLQHYGLQTRWLDVVDSLPHALFFALNSMVKSPFEPEKFSYIPSTNRFGYLYIIELPNLRPCETAGSPVSGLWGNEDGVLLTDLRASRSSLALRPHAQHGFLFKQKGVGRDFWGCVVAQIGFRVADAAWWIRGAEAQSRQSMFPSRKWDGVYGPLLSLRGQNWFREVVDNAPYKAGTIWDFDFHDPEVHLNKAERAAKA